MRQHGHARRLLDLFGPPVEGGLTSSPPEPDPSPPLPWLSPPSFGRLSFFLDLSSDRFFTQYFQGLFPPLTCEDWPDGT